MDIGTRIKYFRNKAKLTQDELAEKVGISKNGLWNYENNKREIGVNLLNNLAEALEVTTNDLLGTTPIRLEFVNDFDLNIFDEEVMQYVLKLKNALKKNLNGENITNTTILQNLVINRMANDKALKKTGMFVSKLWLEFTTDESGNLITGKELENLLVENYTQEYLNEKLRNLESRFQYIYEFEEGSEELELIKEYYNDIPKHKISTYMLEKIYPEYLEENKKG